jgi:hypothetical protein
MQNKPPQPLCKAFLVLSQIVDPPNGEISLIGLPRRFQKSSFPAATPVAFFARLTSAHGYYQVEVQLQTPDGQTAWREGPPNPWSLHNPLELYDLKLNLFAAFPKPGRYDFVLLTNGDEIARQPFLAELVPPPETRPLTQGDSDEG